MARWGMIVSDLTRSSIGPWLVRVVMALLRCHRITRHDGIISFQRAFSRSEFEAVARESKIDGLKVVRGAWSRTLLVWCSNP